MACGKVAQPQGPLAQGLRADVSPCTETAKGGGGGGGGSSRRHVRSIGQTDLELEGMPCTDDNMRRLHRAGPSPGAAEQVQAEAGPKTGCSVKVGPVLSGGRGGQT